MPSAPADRAAPAASQLLERTEVELRDHGAAFVQFDEPVLTEIVMSEENDKRTFM